MVHLYQYWRFIPQMMQTSALQQTVCLRPSLKNITNFPCFVWGMGEVKLNKRKLGWGHPAIVLAPLLGWQGGCQAWSRPNLSHV